MQNNPGAISEQPDALHPIEPSPDLMDVIAEIERRVSQLQSVERELPDSDEVSREREAQLRELADQQYRVEERERQQSELSRQMAEQQAEIERLQTELSAREQEIASREQNVQGQAEQLEQMRESLAAAKAELAKQQQAAKHLAEAQEREQRRLAEYKQFLAQREQELEQQAEQQRKMRRELTQLASKLAEAEKQNKADAKRTDEERALAEKRIKELESRCQALEESCRTLRNRRAQTALSAEPAPSVISPRVGASPTSPLAGLLVLLATVVMLGMAAVLGLYLDQSAGALWVAGASFLVPLMACAAIKHRGVDFGLTLVAVFSGMLGFWFEPWMGVVTSALELWHLPLEIVPETIVPQLPMAAAVLTSMLALSIATGLACDDFEILFRGILVSAATSAILLPAHSGVESVAAAVSVWVLLHTLMLIKWAVPDRVPMFGPTTSIGRPAF
ncbi:MAG: hypothetical protein D6695_08040 [Planctomycetota bacterium]|nr:MAG: hypothetical protein D6695_08040 [Planctomycetota bacterium]